MISFTVPLDVCTIVVTVVTSYSSSGDCCGPLCCECVCVEMSVVVVSPGGAYDSVWDSVKSISGNYFFYYFQYQEDVGVSAC